MARRPHWYRSIHPGAEPMVPLRVAHALQEERDLAVAHLQRAREQAEELARDREGLAERLQALERALVRADADVQAARQRAVAQEAAARARLEAQDAAAPPPEEVTALKTRLANLTSDLANIRRHQEQAIARARTMERAERLKGLIDVYDAVERSLRHSTEPESPWHVGNLAVLAQVRSAITAAGAQEVGQVGEAFDPRIAEAIAQVPDTGAASGTIVQVEGVGFVLEDGTVVRPAQVVIAQ